MRNFFALKVNQYNLCNNYQLKLPNTNTCRCGKHILCFKGSLLWNKVPSKYKKINTLEEFKTEIKT